MEIENRLYRYAEIDKTIAEIEQKINDAMPSQSTSIVLFGVTGGQLICSIQENFYARKDIYGMVSKIMKLEEEKILMDKIFKKMNAQERQTYKMCFVHNLAAYDVRRVMGIDRTTLYRRKMLLLQKVQQNLTQYDIIDMIGKV